ncbi:MAG: nucleoside triphosphate pyrophosphohydrolase [Alkalispirochaeta sp.]
MHGEAPRHKSEANARESHKPHLASTEAHPFPDVSEEIGPYRRSYESAVFEEYSAIVRRLRAPDGCPWDRKQTLHSLRRFIIEESFELLTAIHEHNDSDSELDSADNGAHVAEELGDVLLVAMLIAGALETVTGISLDEVLRTNGEKLIRRHPHVFGDIGVSTPDQVVANWNQIKKEQEGREDSPSSVGTGMPPLERAYEIQRKAEKLGFDWPPRDIAAPISKLREEIVELESRISEIGADTDPGQAKDDPETEREIGDILFSAVNVSRRLKTDPSVALSRTNERFLSRFGYIESALAERHLEFRDRSLSELDALWNEAKKRERDHHRTDDASAGSP